MIYFFRTLKMSLVNSFRGRRIFFHLAAVALTAVIVLSGFDWYYFSSTRVPFLQIISFPAVAVGALLPILLPLLLLFFGHVRRHRDVRLVAWALGQAALLGWLISSVYKAFTGRIPPELVKTVDTSRQFNFGFWENGIFWGWPSSHTAVAFAMAFALISLYPRSRYLRWVALLYALYIGLGISVTIHWFSEFVAGALIGTAIGLAVGETYKKLTSV
jgi:membrane-associated phospholipid phosphatase